MHIRRDIQIRKTRKICHFVTYSSRVLFQDKWMKNTEESSANAGSPASRREYGGRSGGVIMSVIEARLTVRFYAVVTNSKKSLMDFSEFE